MSGLLDLLSAGGVSSPDIGQNPEDKTKAKSKGWTPAQEEARMLSLFTPIQKRQTFGQGFADGFATGLLAPTAIFRGPQEEEIDPYTQETIAGQIGEVVGSFAGMGITFIPFLAGARGIMTGIGLTRALNPAVFNLMSRGLARKEAIRFAGRKLREDVVEGAIAGAMFDVLASESVEDIPKNVLMYGAIGSALDVALGGTARVLRGWKGVRPSGELRLRGMDPDVVAMERLLSPSIANDPDKLADLIDGYSRIDWDVRADEFPAHFAERTQEQVRRLVVRSWNDAVERGGGSAIITGLKDPDKWEAALRSEAPDIAAVIRRDTKEEGTDLLLSTNERLVELVSKRKASPVTDPMQVLKQLVAGSDQPLEYPVRIAGYFARTGIEAYNAVAPLVKKLLDQATDLDEDQRRRLIWEFKSGALSGNTSVGGAAGVAWPNLNITWIRGMMESSQFNSQVDRIRFVVSTIAHEYMHLFSGRIAGAAGDSTFNYKIKSIFQPKYITQTIKDLFPDIEADPTLGHVGQLSALDFDRVLNGQEGDIAKELLETTLAITRLKKGHTEQSALAEVRRGWDDYYGINTELFSRLVEVMMTDKALAMQIAPRASMLMSSVLQEESKVFKAIIEGGMISPEAKRFGEQLAGLWVMEDGVLARQFKEQMGDLVGKKEMNQFRAFGIHQGQGVLHDGHWWEVRRFTRVKNPETFEWETRIDIIDTISGFEKNVDFKEITRPTLGMVMKRAEKLEKALGEEMLKPLKWVAFRAVDPDNPYGTHKVLVDLRDFDHTENLDRWIRQHQDLSDPERVFESPEFKMEVSNITGLRHNLEMEQSAKIRNRQATTTNWNPKWAQFLKHPEKFANLQPGGFVSIRAILKELKSVAEMRMERVGKILKYEGKSGLVINENGNVRLLIATPDVVEKTSRTFSEEMISAIEFPGRGDIDSPGYAQYITKHNTPPVWRDFSPEEKLRGYRLVRVPEHDVLVSRLFEAGASSRDLGYLENVARAGWGKVLRRELDPVERRLVETSLARWREVYNRKTDLPHGDGSGGVPEETAIFVGKAKDQDTPASAIKAGPTTRLPPAPVPSQPLVTTYSLANADYAARASNLRIEEQGVGRVVVTEDNGVAVFVTDDIRKAREYVSRVGPDVPARELDDRLDIRTSTLVQEPVLHPQAGGNPLPQMQIDSLASSDYSPTNLLGKVKQFIRGSSYGIAGIKSMEKFARQIQREGFGQAYTKVFHVLQIAAQELDREYVRITRKELGNLSIHDFLQRIEKKVYQVVRARRELLVDAKEAMSREEIARPGGLLPRGMNKLELDDAVYFESLGLRHRLPRLMALNRVINNLMENSRAFLGNLGKMKEAPETTPEFMEVLLKLEQAALGEDKDWVSIVNRLGLTDAELLVMSRLQNVKQLSGDQYSIHAVARWLDAESLKPGYATMRDQFMDEHKFSQLEREIVGDLDTVFDLTFKMSGMDRKRMLGGYWPHLRKLAKYGFTPDEPSLMSELREGWEWSAVRFRTGELDVYAKDPVLTTYRHIRGLLNKKHIDPLMPDVQKELEMIGLKDPRAERIMTEYVNEMWGRPHDSFTKLSQAVNGMLVRTGFGHLRSSRVGENIVNGMITLVSGAAIPFRLALVLRNLFSGIATIAPRTGTKYFWEAAAMVFNTDPKIRHPAYDEARKFLAVTENKIPIHQSTEIFETGLLGVKTPEWMGGMGEDLAYKMRLMMERGFRFYQWPDDAMRAIAYFAQKMRMRDNLQEYVERKDWNRFARKSKLLMFEEEDIAMVKAAFEKGEYEEGMAIAGRQLARETIFRYGHANHPAGWGSVYGRLFGQFGTWPVQYKDYILQGMSRGTAKDKAEFAAIHLGLNAAVVGLGYGLGWDTRSWATTPSLTYAGGPYAQIMVDFAMLMGGSEVERNLAWQSIKYAFPTFEDPSSLFIPGSYFFGDISDALETGHWTEGLGFRVLDRKETSMLKWTVQGMVPFMD